MLADSIDNGLLNLANIYIDKSKKSDKGNDLEGLIGVVYLDPTDLSKVCTKEDVLQNVNEY